MENNFKQLISFYEELYHKTNEISQLLNKDNSAFDIEKAVFSRSELLKKMDLIIKNNKFTQTEKIALNEWVNKIKNIEEKNTNLITKIHSGLKKEINYNQINKQAFSAYKTKVEQKPVMFDTKE